MKHLLGLKGLPLADGKKILALTKEYKANRGRSGQPLQGQTWALIFSKPSTRTRVSFEVALRELGAGVMFLNASEIQWGRGEPIKDMARVLGRMLHGAVIRTFAQDDVEQFAEFSQRPTVNALTDEEHPCQVLADIFTFEEKHGSIAGKKVAFIGDAACNMGQSWAYAADIFGFDLVAAAPEGFGLRMKNARVRNVISPAEAAKDAHLLYTDVWVSMGKEDEATERMAKFSGYQINHDLVKVAAPNAMVLHCLPAYRGKEITEAIFEERAQDIFDEAENRLHVQKGILDWMTR